MRMAIVAIEDFCIALYCAYARHDALKPDADARIVFTARVLDGDCEDYVRVECVGVREYVFRTESEWGPDDRLELSVVELEGQPGDWRVWFNPWYCHEIEFRCSRILVNGADVVGRGRHLQDALPHRSAVVPPYASSGG